MLEAVGRLLPGVLGNISSAADDSFGGTGGPMVRAAGGPGLHPAPEWRGHQVPEVLLSGNHAAIARWRRDMALRRTARNRPDLLPTIHGLDAQDRQILAEDPERLRAAVFRLAQSYGTLKVAVFSG